MSLVGAASAGASSTMSRALPPALAKFAHCPVNVAAVTTCLFSSTATTQFSIGSTTVSSPNPTTVSIGLIYKSNGTIQSVLPTDGTSALNAPQIPLPNGLLGLPPPFPNVLPANTQPQLVGLPVLSLKALLSQKGVAFALPIQVKVTDSHGLLGSNCTIGGSTSPIRLHLTTGTTNPPAPNKPISGSRGALSGGPNGQTIDSGLRIVDNAFAVGGANNCGLLPLVIDPIINAQKGLPSAAGNNTAILSGASYLVPASVIRQYIH